MQFRSYVKMAKQITLFHVISILTNSRRNIIIEIEAERALEQFEIIQKNS